MSTFQETVKKEMTRCYLVYINPALPASNMIFGYVSPPILVKLNKVARICFVMEHRHRQSTCKVNLDVIITLNHGIFCGFIKPYIKTLINQHFNFLFKPVTSLCSVYCYELCQTV